VTIPIYRAAELRRAVRFTDLIEPLRVAFGEFSQGRAQQVMSALWPARRPEDGTLVLAVISVRAEHGAHAACVRPAGAADGPCRASAEATA